MSSDEQRQVVKRPRPIERPVLACGPLRGLVDAVYLLYVHAGTPTLDVMERCAAEVADELDLPGVPKRGRFAQLIGGHSHLDLYDAQAVAMVLAHLAGRSPQDAKEQIKELWAAVLLEPPTPRLGRPVAECSPTEQDLGVHVAADAPGHHAVDPLPTYVHRGHDQTLAEVVEASRAGRSGLVTLVGDSSTGKTHACWQAALQLDDRWRLWHPSHTEELLDGLPQLGPHTLVWLNEAQRYFRGADAARCEEAARRLRQVMLDVGVRPVLVLATLWPEHWHALTAQPQPNTLDIYPQARDLLAGSAEHVPPAFTGADLKALHATGDPRLMHAAKHAAGGRITQQLAGVPQLLDRYTHAQPTIRALLDVAIDARRLGYPEGLPHWLLATAAPGYMEPGDWQACSDDWLELALSDTVRPAHGLPGPLTRVKPLPHQAVPGTGMRYQLSDALEQHGRCKRRATFPPASFWTAVATTETDTKILFSLAGAAARRCRDHRTWQLLQAAADLGSTDALRKLAQMREAWGEDKTGRLFFGDIDSGDIAALSILAQSLELAGEWDDVERLAVRATELGQTYLLARQAERLDRSGLHEDAERLATHAAELGDTDTLGMLAQTWEENGRREDAERLALRAAEFGDSFPLSMLAQIRELAGNRDEAERLLMDAVPGSASALGRLAELRYNAGQRDDAERLYVLAADLDDAFALGMLALMREDSGQRDDAEHLALRAANLGHITALARLAPMRDRTSKPGDAEHLAIHAANLGHTEAIQTLTQKRETDGKRQDAERLAIQAAELGDLLTLRQLAIGRMDAGLPDEAARLFARAAEFGDTFALGELARMREENGLREIAERLALRAADLGNTHALEELAHKRVKSGQPDDVERLALRAAVLGHTVLMKIVVEAWERADRPDDAERLAFHAAGLGDTYALGWLAQARADSGHPNDAERLALHAADLGNAFALHMLTLSQTVTGGGTPMAQQPTNFRLTDSGQLTSQPPWEQPQE